ncbi:MAG TPA: hypothetical protein VFB81_12935, partial [Myxococcales bacterium]|nr:hypothetical protein [Myxococcales bacterium]
LRAREEEFQALGARLQQERRAHEERLQAQEEAAEARTRDAARALSETQDALERARQDADQLKMAAADERWAMLGHQRTLEAREEELNQQLAALRVRLSEVETSERRAAEKIQRLRGDLEVALASNEELRAVSEKDLRRAEGLVEVVVELERHRDEQGALALQLRAAAEAGEREARGAKLEMEAARRALLELQGQVDEERRAAEWHRTQAAGAAAQLERQRQEYEVRLAEAATAEQAARDATRRAREETLQLRSTLEEERAALEVQLHALERQKRVMVEEREAFEAMREETERRFRAAVTGTHSELEMLLTAEVERLHTPSPPPPAPPSTPAPAPVPAPATTPPSASASKATPAPKAPSLWNSEGAPEDDLATAFSKIESE